ncbi:uncharacterized protein [Physcomitrium patens]|uniref:Uncharacterized protein n=1 Tax=Physcomitrium patens TaxID=3218 RepID=A0A2K1JE02_PHYPA|nr:uncharacterized protein LOC112292065 isoform X1 [Physcomitrium patens]PNR39756.1 hypothetical protein PHYPA_020036 [Physcomitrium patens]|eukprot:XP_024395957.1 uncharacterized protein LOC112292065 isoform X1 [Physcomitrella patens]
MASRELFRRGTSVLHRPVQPRVALASLQQAKRGFAQERPQDSSTSNWGAGEPPIDEKNTERGVPPKSDSEGQVPTPSLNRQKSTRDFIITKREEKLNAAKTSKRPPGVDLGAGKQQENVKDQ